MRSIGVNLCIRPRLLREIVRHVLERAGQLTVEREFSDPRSLLEIGGDGSTLVLQWVQTGERDEINSVWKALFKAQPGQVIVALEAAPEQVSIITACSCVTRPLCEVADLLAAIRAAATRQRTSTASTGATPQVDARSCW